MNTTKKTVSVAAKSNVADAITIIKNAMKRKGFTLNDFYNALEQMMEDVARQEIIRLHVMGYNMRSIAKTTLAPMAFVKSVLSTHATSSKKEPCTSCKSCKNGSCKKSKAKAK